MENITITKNENLEYLQFNKLLEFKDEIIHAFTLTTFNFGLDKDEENRKESFKIIARTFNVNEENIIKAKQTHTDNILEIKNQELKLKDVDGLITDRKDKALAVSFADCIDLLMYDPKEKVIANVHSGWKGTTKKIAQKTIYKMIQDYNCKPENIICCIGPALRKDHFLVNEDVVQIFENEFNDYCKNYDIIEKTEYSNEKGIQYKIDTILINKLMLEDMELLPKNIIDSNICTMCSCDKFHSHRIEGKDFKKNLGLIMLK